jgi:hypothetical protein
MDAMTAERIGRNDSAFRDANEQIRGKAREHQTADDQLIPFICECADEECTVIIQLNLAQYEDVRTDSRQFLNVIGHERSEGLVEIVLTNHDHLVVRKSGRAGEVAEALDARRDGHRKS